ncbi:DUF1501 domain-containing protein [Planctomyces sp. SH-PL14]|uniref:DUF1501 domain-containing protein n=1 Tax=Planctomyces sp. SH-PL14 TaxID=1632864 RepID=UPI00078C094F|nr:DUF1501 domain-containing protein [Planctomyces sp. SH-PL14]AMV18680.1 hypothetical protein VT03_12355 [Planctomyces sp. SH-PL14]
MSFENSPPLSRRRFVTGLGAGMGGIGLAQVLAANSSLSPAAVTGLPRAKRIIQLFMNGGPFGPDFFDPKPALLKYEGQRPDAANLRTERKTGGLLPSPFAYQPAGESGVPVSELLPHFAQCIDDVAVLRSVYTDNPNHGPALQMMNTGFIVPTKPSVGAWMLYGLGVENQNLPGYIVLCPGRPVRFSILWSSGFLPGEYQGTYVNHTDMAADKLIPYLRSDRPQADQERQLDLFRALNAEHLAEREADAQLTARIQSMETAFRMQTSASEAFDLSKESEQTRAEYGTGHFANSCLLARRLAERGVRLTQIYYGNGQPWDTHSGHDKSVRGLAQDIDRPMAALLRDLKQRGLLEETLVVWGGEFGRTPTTENGNGRDHNHYGFTMWMAGGGVRGGMTYGETDEFGFKAAVKPVHVHDLHATILHLLGIDHTRLTYRYAGRDFRLTDVHGRVIREIVS